MKEMKLTELEIKIMRVLWENEKHVTIQEIGTHLAKEKSVQHLSPSLLKV